MKTLMIIAGVVAAAAIALVAVWVYVVQNVETPDYEALAQEGDFELRRYPELTLATVDRSGDRREALSRGFSPLAGYIFAKERQGDKIAMTAPVTQSPGEGDAWSVGFIMPSGYTRADLPDPADPAIRLTTRPPETMAAVRFSGHASDADIAREEDRLRGWIEGRGLEIAGKPVYAYYNDPFTPGFLRRNEVLLPVTDPDGSS